MKVRIHRFSEEQRISANKDLTVGDVATLYSKGLIKVGLLLESGQLTGTIQEDEADE